MNSISPVLSDAVSGAGIASRIRSWRPFLHEWLAITFIAVGVLILETLPVTYPRSALLLAYSSPAALVAVLAGLGMLIRWWLCRGEARQVPLRDELLLLMRCVLVIAAVLPVHFLLKSFIHLINPATWDLALARWDTALHLGFNPSILLITLFHEPWVLRAIDAVYSGLYYLVFVSYLAGLLLLLPPRLKVAFTAAFVWLWMIGTIFYIALPSWGPVFVFPAAFEETLRSMPATVGVQSVLYEEISSLVRDPLAPRVVRFGSVAAFPSLHLAVVALFTLASRRCSQRWFRINLVLVAVMLIGSVITGYHYLIDGWAGIALAAGCWWAATRVSWRPDATAVAENECGVILSEAAE